MSKKHGRLRRAYCMAILCFPLSVPALTRWSTLHLIPDADFLESWNYSAEYAGYYFSDKSEGTSFANSGSAHIGVSEWVDIHAGFAGGVTLGLKAKILGENTRFLPSLAAGVWNVVNHREDHYYHHDPAVWKNEFFIALGKSVEPVRVRLHLGVQSMPEVAQERYGCFFGLEKYLGGDVYVTLETLYRDKKLRPSLFANLRVFKQRVEVSAGAVDMAGMLSERDGKYSVSFSLPDPSTERVRPGLWLGFRFRGGVNTAAGRGGFSSVEEQLGYQRDMLRLLKRDVDSLKRALAGREERADSLEKSVQRIADSALGATRGARLREFVIERLIVLSTLYGQENFDAEKIASTTAEITSYGDLAAPVLRDVALDNNLDRKVHSLAVTMLGAVGTRKAADAVLDVLAQTQDPDVKIEGLIAVGTMKDRRATYLVEHLASDPDRAVAFVADEVLHKLGKPPSGREDTASAPPGPSFPATIPESKIAGAPGAGPGPEMPPSPLPGETTPRSGKATERGKKRGNDTARMARSPVQAPSADTSSKKSAAVSTALPAIAQPKLPASPAALPPHGVSDSVGGRHRAVKTQPPASPMNPEKPKDAVKPRQATIDKPVSNASEKVKPEKNSKEENWGADSW